MSRLRTVDFLNSCGDAKDAVATICICTNSSDTKLRLQVETLCKTRLVQPSILASARNYSKDRPAKSWEGKHLMETSTVCDQSCIPLMYEYSIVC